MKKIAIIGNGGHAREVINQIQKYCDYLEIHKFVDEQYYIDGDPKLFLLSKLNINEYKVMVAIADSQKRFDVVSRLPKETEFFSFIHPKSLLREIDMYYDNIKIGIGSYVGQNSILTCDITIGDHCILNRGNQIGHDCVIGDYFSAMPGAIVSGNVTVGDRVNIGTNSSVREKIMICNDVTIGLNTGIVKNITESGIYVGQKIIKL